MSKLVDLVTEYFWRRAFSPLLDRLDGRDLWFLAGLVLAGIVQWLIFWEGQPSIFPTFETFNAEERQRWASLLLVVPVVWFASRNTRTLIRATPRAWRTISIPLLALFIIAFPLGWAWAIYDLYRPVPFSENSVGIYVARLNGDNEDRVQKQLLSALQAARQRQVSAVPELAINALPRRVENHARARELGEAGGATLVMWGSVRGQMPVQAPTLSSQVELQLTPVGFMGASSAGTSRASIVEDNWPVLIGEFREDLAEALLLFVAGYERLSFPKPDFIQALDYLTRANERLPTELEARTLEQSLHASILFYTANAIMGCASLEETSPSPCGLDPDIDPSETAIDLYFQAAKLIAEPEHDLKYSSYVEALNNFGRLQMDINMDEAETALSRAIQVCKDQDLQAYPPNPWACLHASYNFGQLLQREQNYAEAFQYFLDVVNCFEQDRDCFQRLVEAKASPSLEPDYWFLANAHQSIAFGYAKLAERAEIENDVKKKESYLTQAENSIANATKVVQAHNARPLSLIGILQARIHIARHKWREADEALRDAESEASVAKYASFFLLSGIARQCLGASEQAMIYLKRYCELDNGGSDPSQNTDLDYYDAITKDCTRLSWQC